ncbi:hypothetical protein [Psychrosphaera algicola]|uniref:Polysaccharide deacetylase n=1 Tax=Psychrosphaera algicola TaxID=3023714 RepID=A0ABT5FHW3_9GAMM|nr:hypothetical protein [Psychrosphaera sp. G1-22]MDC2890781.1 hypothetical protein [Psychrosphaera sp. G1-22]
MKNMRLLVKPLVTRLLKGNLLSLLALVTVVFGVVACSEKTTQLETTKTKVVKNHLHDNTPPKVSKWTKSPTVLVFSKTNEWRHNEGIAAADLHFVRLAQKFNYGIFTTTNGAIFNDLDLKSSTLLFLTMRQAMFCQKNKSNHLNVG